MSPVQAGIRPLSTANSSFILDLLLRSMRLCAVLRAILRPAALVAEVCFFLDPDSEALLLEVVPVPVVALAALAAADVDVVDSAWAWGFIWMILRDLVGGGGKANASFCCCCCWAAADDRLRALTASLGCTGYVVLGETEALLPPTMADGGSSKAIWRCERLFEVSWPLISVDELGVGGMDGRGMADLCLPEEPDEKPQLEWLCLTWCSWRPWMV